MKDLHFIRKIKKKLKSQQSRINLLINQRNLSLLNAELTIFLSLLMITTNHKVYSKGQLRIMSRTFKNSLSQKPISRLYKQKKKYKKHLNLNPCWMKFGEHPYQNHKKVLMKFLCNMRQNFSLLSRHSKFNLRNTSRSNRSPTLNQTSANEAVTLTWTCTTK